MRNPFYSAGADVYNRGFACFDSAENPRQYACVTKTGVFADFGTPCLSFKAKYQGQIYAPSSNHCRRERSCEVDLPFSRDELANYLAVDRASLSRALGELKKAGIIEFKKSHFKLIETAEYHFD